MPDSALLGPASAPELHVMTLNLHRIMPGLNPLRRSAWPRRRPALQRLLRTERPTILAVQEALPRHLAAVRQTLPRHEAVGRGRDARGRDEGNSIFFDSERLRLEGWRQIALSDTPEKPGSRSWGNWLPRILVSAHFVDRVTGLPLHVVNTHLDHLSLPARLKGARSVRAELGDGPTIVTGDMNAGTDSATFRAFTEDGFLVDAWEAAAERRSENWGTFADYGPPRRGRRRIDWILVGGGVEVVAAAINPFRPGGQAPSDHLPVQALVTARR